MPAQLTGYLIAAQWDHEANDCTPDDVVAQSHQRVNWHCDVCGCKWKAVIFQRVCKALRTQRGCPRCAAKARSKNTITHPTFAECNHPLLAEWDHRRNEARGNFPDNTKLQSSKRIFWLCSKCPAGQQHSWPAKPASRTGRSRTGCPYCAGKNACKCNSLQALYPDTAVEWEHSRNQGQPSDYPASSYSVVWWSSPQRGSWQQTIHSRTNQVHQKIARPKRIQERQSHLVQKSLGQDWTYRDIRIVAAVPQAGAPTVNCAGLRSRRQVVSSWSARQLWLANKLLSGFMKVIKPQNLAA
ncbi:hypothetical protein ABBQ38_004626 [Trebouxia sp. C0009 RCD-2024]